MNSGSSLVLECSQVVIDSIDYSIVGFDNLLEQGHSIELKEDYDSWENKFDPESWCISETSHTLNGIALFGTPGAKNECTSSD